MHLARVCELPEANPLPKADLWRWSVIRWMLSVSQCPVRTKRHEAATLQRDVEGIPEFPDQNCSQCSCRTCRTLKMRKSGLTWFKFSMELQQCPLKHIIHTQNPFLSVTGGGVCVILCQSHSLRDATRMEHPWPLEIWPVLAFAGSHRTDRQHLWRFWRHQRSRLKVAR